MSLLIRVVRPSESAALTRRRNRSYERVFAFKAGNRRRPRLFTEIFVEIIMLGTGTITPSLRRNASCLVVQEGERRLLVDMGPGTIRRLCDAAISLSELDTLLVTHFHPDHVSDLAPILFASNYAYADRRTEPFSLIGPRGLRDYYDKFRAIYHEWITPTDDRLTLHELSANSPDRLESGELLIRSTSAAHSDPSLSYRIDGPTGSVVVSGDTDVSSGLVDLAQGADILVCETSFPDHLKHEGHLTPSGAGRIAQAAGVKTLVMTHFYPPCDQADMVGEAKVEFDGMVIKAEDLMRIPVIRA